MRIPKNADVLILGTSISALTLAVLLSKNGLNILVIDERSAIDEPLENSLELNQYNHNLLELLGFEFPDKTTTLGYETFYQQSFKLLANYVGAIIWGSSAKIINKNSFELKNEEQSHQHDCAYSFKADDLNISTDINLSLLGVFFLGWRVIGALQNRLKPAILASHDEEIALIIQQQKAEKTKLNTYLKKLTFKEKKASPNLIGSQLSLHLSQERALEAGELLLDLPVYDEKQKITTSLYQWCGYQQFSVFVLGDLLPANLFSIARWLQLNYHVQLYYLPQTEKNQSVFDYFKLRKGERKTLIIRPDRFIGLVHDTVDIDIIDNYLSNFLQMIAKETPNTDESTI